jgi:hypothetical protein
MIAITTKEASGMSEDHLETDRDTKLSELGLDEEGTGVLAKYGVETLGDLVDLDVEDAEIRERDALLILESLLRVQGEPDKSDRELLAQIREGEISAQDGLAWFIEGLSDGCDEDGDWEEDDEDEDWDEDDGAEEAEDDDGPRPFPKAER